VLLIFEDQFAGQKSKRPDQWQKSANPGPFKKARNLALKVVVFVRRSYIQQVALTNELAGNILPALFHMYHTTLCYCCSKKSSSIAKAVKPATIESAVFRAPACFSETGISSLTDMQIITPATVRDNMCSFATYSAYIFFPELKHRAQLGKIRRTRT
jgi:hypothetical protein